jgi:hypothetical protein
MPAAWCLADPKLGEHEVAAGLLALAAAIWHNWATTAPVKRSLTACGD